MVEQPEVNEVLIRHADAIARMLGDKSVQQVFTDLDAKYAKDWKAASSPEERENLWYKQRVLGELKFVLEGAVVAGQAEAARIASLTRQV